MAAQNGCKLWKLIKSLTFKLVPLWGMNMLPSVPLCSNPICASKIVEKISVNTWATSITAVFCVLQCWTGKGSEWLHWTLNLKQQYLKKLPCYPGRLFETPSWAPVFCLSNGQISSKSNSGCLNLEYPSSLKSTWKLVISRSLFGAFSPFQGNVLELPSKKALTILSVDIRNVNFSKKLTFMPHLWQQINHFCPSDIPDSKSLHKDWCSVMLMRSQWLFQIQWCCCPSST